MLARGASALRGVGEVRVSAELGMPEGEMETAVCRLPAVLGVEGVGAASQRLLTRPARVLFSPQVLHSQSRHGEVRMACIHYLRENRERFEEVIDDFNHVAVP